MRNIEQDGIELDGWVGEIDVVAHPSLDGRLVVCRGSHATLAESSIVNMRHEASSDIATLVASPESLPGV